MVTRRATTGAGRARWRAADDRRRARRTRSASSSSRSLYADHDRLLAERGALDFGDLIAARVPAAARAARTCASAWRARFRHVLVDEYQDTNFAQGMLLRLLVRRAPQRDASWATTTRRSTASAGASQKNLLDFEREFPDATIVRLERNYRSGRRILDAAAAVVAPVRRPDREEAHAARAAARVRFWRCRSERAQAQAVAAEVERLIARRACRPSEICVLVRSVKNEGAVIAAALEERAMPVPR